MPTPVRPEPGWPFAAPQDLRFEVEDDGTGFDPAMTSRGAGLTNMADRLDALGGGIEVDSTVGSGAHLQGRVPVVEPAVQPA
jgi:signal transduction histidine kinase